MEIRSVEFIKSTEKISNLPQSSLPEYAFIGRSNVGKSSLINLLTGKKGLAKTSSKAGKTVLINHFLVNERWYLVDLPGYGYAKISKEEKKRIQKLALDYILYRNTLYFLFVLVDSRLSAQKIDLEFIELLAQNEVPFGLIFTKIDKLTTSKLTAAISAYKKELKKTWENLPPIFESSFIRGDGRKEILDYIKNI